MESPHVPGRFDSRHVGQLQEPARRYAEAEAPPLRLAGLEVGERLPADGVHENIARMTVQRFDGPGKLPAMTFELRDVHDGQVYAETTQGTNAQQEVLAFVRTLPSKQTARRKVGRAKTSPKQSPAKRT